MAISLAFLVVVRMILGVGNKVRRSIPVKLSWI